MDTFGKRVKHLRAGMSQAAFAAQLGIPQTTLSNYEKDRNEPKFDLIQRISIQFRVNVEWLLYGTGPMRRDELPGQTSSLAGPDKKDARIRELEQQLAEAKEETLRAYRLAAQAMQPIINDIQRQAPTQNTGTLSAAAEKRIDHPKQE